MAIDTDQVIADALAAPKSVTNAAGEHMESRSADEIIALIDRAKNRRPGRPPFAVTRAIMPGAVGPRSGSSE